jgi:kynurenine formamidase
MKILDLTHTITEDMPVYPGTPPPTLREANTVEKDGFKETLLSMYSHTGTHVDAPAHVFAGKMTLDAFPASQFTGKALVIDCRALSEGDAITMAQLAPYGGRVKEADFLLFCLGFDKKWGSPAYFGDYPCLDDEVMALILAGDYKGIGFDVIGLDPVHYDHLKRHKQLFAEKEIINIENLCRLDECGDKLFDFACLPLKYENADGAPARAIAWVE